VIDDFRGADMAAGGHGAPLAPLYHAARLRAADVPYPVCILNLGGVANVTWVAGAGAGDGAGEGIADGAGESIADGAEPGDADGLVAFDTGPASAMIDDWVREKTGKPFDEGGALAASGRVDQAALALLLADPYFAAPPPKSLDRRDFDPASRVMMAAGLTTGDGAATLCAFTAGAVARAAQFLPEPPRAWYATGGGRHNATLMAAIGEALGGEIRPVEDLGWNGDMLEAEAFAYLAVRSLKGFALSLPATTGVATPTTGGRLNRP
jgi:anhydro-N-acetylmuramic acid kinase